MSEGSPRAAATVTFLVLLAVTVGIAAFLQSLMTLSDCNPYPCQGIDVWGPRLAWAIPALYAVAGGVHLARGWSKAEAEPLWPWLLSAGLVAVSITAVTCFTVVWS